MKAVFFINKKGTFYWVQLFLKPKQWFCQIRYCINQNTGIFWNKLIVRCHFGFWPLGRVRFEVTFNLIRPVLSFFYQIGWVFFCKFAETWEYFNRRDPTGKMSNRDPCNFEKKNYFSLQFRRSFFTFFSWGNRPLPMRRKSWRSCQWDNITRLLPPKLQRRGLVF